MLFERVALNFARLSDTKLDAFTDSVIAKMTGNASFPTPKVAMPDLQTALDVIWDAGAAINRLIAILEFDAVQSLVN
jgi:hypothetical protein